MTPLRLEGGEAGARVAGRLSCCLAGDAAARRLEIADLTHVMTLLHSLG